MKEKIHENRLPQFDIAKGICIILMVLGHVNSPGTHFFYLFHMASFFIMSGYFVKTENLLKENGLIHFVKKRAKMLYLPYIQVNIILAVFFGFINMIGIHQSVFIDYSSFSRTFVGILTFGILGGTHKLAGATWFLRVLFEIDILFSVIYKIVRKKISEKWSIALIFVFSLLLLVIGWILNNQKIEYEILGIKIVEKILPVFIVFWTYVLGVLLQQSYFTKINFGYISLTISWIALLILNQNGSIELIKEITNPIYFICATIAGFCFVYSVSIIILKVRFISNILVYIGQNTLPILLWHLTWFRVLIYFQTMSLYAIFDVNSIFPYYNNNNMMWALYGVLGIAGPLAIKRVVNVFRRRFCKYVVILNFTCFRFFENSSK